MTVKELIKSRHFRLKIECLLLVMYTLYHGNGIVYLVHLYFSGDVSFFGDDDWIGLNICSILSGISIFLFWLLAFRIIIHFHYEMDNIVWQQRNRTIAFFAGFFWCVSIVIWTISLLFTENFTFWLFLLAFVPAWNKWLAIALVMTIFRECGNNYTRRKRVLEWMRILAIYISPYVLVSSLLVFIGLFGAGIFGLLLTIPIAACIIGMFCVLCYHLGCCCEGANCCFCIKENWIVAGMICFWFLTTYLLNQNYCYAESIVIEFVSGFRGAALLLIFYSVMVVTEIKYGGPINPMRPVTINADDDNNADAPMATVELETRVSQASDSGEGLNIENETAQEEAPPPEVR